MARGVQKKAPVPRSLRSEQLKGTVVIMLTCDYNGWNDAPEEEREWFDEHPEVWNAATRDLDGRPHRATPRPPVRRFRGGLAA